MIQIEVQKNIVNFYKDDRESSIYSIRKDELPLAIDNGKYKVSEWVYHLMSKTWIEGNTLYELAVLIQNEFPDNKINWVETFFPVEKGLYLDHVKKTKQLTSENKKSSFSFRSLFESIETGIEEQNDFINGEVLKIVEINLQKYGLE